jgi:hypothetical protein
MDYDLADEKKAKDREQKNKNERDQELEDIKTLLALPAGIRFFKRIFAEGCMFRTTFTGNSHGMFLEGHRNLALRFFGDVCEAAPGKIPELIIEPKE